MAVAGFVLAIIGVAFGLVPFAFFLAWILGILGLIFSLIGVTHSGRVAYDGRRGLAIAGIILSVAALVLGGVGVAILDDAVGDIALELDEAFGPVDPVGPGVGDVGEEIRFRDGTAIRVHSYEQPAPPGSAWSQPSEGMELGVVDVEVCSSDLSSIGYNRFAVEVRTRDNYRFGAAFGDAREPALSSGELRAGSGCVRGFVTVEVPIGARPAEIVWDYDRRQVRWRVP